MTLLKRHIHNLYCSSRCAHRDESGTEAVEWIAVGAALFMFALALSVVMDGNGSQLGRALTDRVEMVVGKWDNDRSAKTANLRQTNSAIGSVDQLTSGQPASGQPASGQPASGQPVQGESTSGQGAASVAVSAGGSSRNSVNTSASFSGSGASLGAGSSNQSGNKSDSSAPNAEASNQGSLIISGQQVRRDSAIIGGEDTPAESRTRGPLSEVWKQLETRVRPVTDAINRTFASMFREK